MASEVFAKVRTLSFWKASTPAPSCLQSKKMRSSALCLLHAGQLEADAVSYLHTEGPNNLTLTNLVVQVYLLLELLLQKRNPLSIAKQQHWNSLILFELRGPGTFFVLQTDQCPPDFKHLQTNPETISADSAVNPAYGLGRCK